MQTDSRFERRQFLKRATALAIAGGLPTLDTLHNMARAAAPAPVGGVEVGADYKAIVCVFLYGGQDHGNVLIPYQDGNANGDGSAATTAEFDRYAAARSNDGQSPTQNNGNLAYTRAQLAATALPATTSNALAVPGGWTTNTYGRQFALHPSYSELHSLYGGGKLAIIANAGPLVAPINRAQWYGPSASRPPLPVNLYSHDDQQKAWMGGSANIASPGTGIGGRIASTSAIASLNAGAQISTQISVDGTNTFMLLDAMSPNAGSAVPYQVGTGSIGRLEGSAGNYTCNTSSSNTALPYCVSGGPIRVSNGYSWQQKLYAAFRSRISATSENVSIYHDQWRQTMNQSITTEIAVRSAFLNSPPTEEIVAPFQSIVTGNPLAAQLRMVASMIRASNQLGASAASPVKRQIFFVAIGGFDTHGTEFWNSNPTLNRRVSQAINAFWTALGNVRIRDAAGTGYLSGSAQDRVTLVTMTDFGRTLDSNGAGSDHGWGAHQLVLGGAVQGGRIYGMNHNVAAATAGSSVWMSADNTCGAVPRMGVPPDRYNSALTAPGARCNGLNHALDRGEMLPTTSGDAVMANIARWFGVPLNSTAEIDALFPTLRAAHPNGFDMGLLA